MNDLQSRKLVDMKYSLSNAFYNSKAFAPIPFWFFRCIWLDKTWSRMNKGNQMWCLRNQQYETINVRSGEHIYRNFFCLNFDWHVLVDQDHFQCLLIFRQHRSLTRLGCWSLAIALIHSWTPHVLVLTSLTAFLSHFPAKSRVEVKKSQAKRNIPDNQTYRESIKET